MNENQTDEPLGTRFDRLREWAGEHKVAVWSIIALIVALSGLTVAWMHYTQAPVEQAPKNYSGGDLPEADKTYYSALTGLPVESKKVANRQVTGIIIENTPIARPQSGMLKAGVVYEAIAEAGITRFLAIYQESQPRLLGPVRSLRPYFVDWLTPYDAAVVHVGGSLRALQQVRKPGHKDIGQFYNPDAYYRSSDRFAPHNVYTTFDRLNRLNRSKGYTTSKFNSWPRKTDEQVAEPNASSINVSISGPTYDSSYKYHAPTNSYLRSQGGAPHVDREGNKQLHPSVVIIIRVDQQTVMEDGKREQIETIGKGEAYIFQDGTAVKATWQKKGNKQPLKFFKPGTKTEVLLNTGQTWVTALPKGQTVTWR